MAIDSVYLNCENIKYFSLFSLRYIHYIYPYYYKNLTFLQNLELLLPIKSNLISIKEPSDLEFFLMILKFS